MFWDNLQVVAQKGKYIPGKRSPASLWRQSWEVLRNDVGGTEDKWEQRRRAQGLRRSPCVPISSTVQVRKPLQVEERTNPEEGFSVLLVS